MTKSAVGATDVASLLAATLGAISSEDASIRDRLQQLEASITELQNMRHPEVKEATTQTNESGSPEFEALKERVIELERLLHHGSSAGYQLPAEPDEEADEAAEELAQQQQANAEAPAAAAAEAPAVAPAPIAVEPPESPDGSSHLRAPPPSPPTVLDGSSRRAAVPQLHTTPQLQGDTSRILSKKLSSAAHLGRRGSISKPAGLDDAPLLARLARCEQQLAQANAWQAEIRKPLRAELDGLRDAMSGIATIVDALGARAADNDTLRGWSKEVASTVAMLQEEAVNDREGFERRLEQTQVQLGTKADRSEMSRIRAQIGSRPESQQDSNAGADRAVLMRLLEEKADRQDLQRIETALNSAMKPRSVSSGSAPMHDRLSVITQMGAAIADARSAGLTLHEPKDVNMRRPPNALALGPAKVNPSASQPQLKTGNPNPNRRPASASIVKLPSQDSAPKLAVLGSISWTPSANTEETLTRMAAARTIRPSSAGVALGRTAEARFPASPNVKEEPIALGSDGGIYRH